MDVSAVFRRPFEVTQFWVSDRYESTTLPDEAGNVAVLSTVSDKDGKWFAQVILANDGPFVGDFIPPFLPTRANIAVLNAAVGPMLELVRESERVGRFVPPAVSPLAGIVPSPVPVTRSLNDLRYRDALFRVLATDWGIWLPLPEEFGKRTIGLEFRDGLPCGPAMITAVKPILETQWGPLKKGRVTTTNVDDRVIDTVDYQGNGFSARPQAFDVTEFFGKNLDFSRFDFAPPVDDSFAPVNDRTDLIDDLHAYLEGIAMMARKGNDVETAIFGVWQVAAGTQVPMTWLVQRPSLADMLDRLGEATHGRPTTPSERQDAMAYAETLGLYQEGGRTVFRPAPKRPWWKFWG